MIKERKSQVGERKREKAMISLQRMAELLANIYISGSSDWENCLTDAAAAWVSFKKKERKKEI